MHFWCFLPKKSRTHNHLRYCYSDLPMAALKPLSLQTSAFWIYPPIKAWYSDNDINLITAVTIMFVLAGILFCRLQSQWYRPKRNIAFQKFNLAPNIMYIQIQNNNYTAYQYRLKVKVQVKQSTTIMYILVFSKECF